MKSLEISAKIVAITAAVFVAVIVLWRFPASLHPEYSRVVRYRDGTIMRIYITGDEKWRIHCPITRIDTNLVKATLCYEDKYFYWHRGVNVFALARALYKDVKARKVVQGGSTLSMQLARITEHRPRTVISKFIEIVRAIQFEIKLGKRSILEAYFNLAPYGGNIEGVAAASRFYFGKSPRHLSPSEIAFLVSLPRSPSKRNPRTGNLNDIKKGRNRVLKSMFKAKLIDRKTYMRILHTQPLYYTHSLPCEAPYAADFIKGKYPDLLDIKSSIDRGIQVNVENIVKSYKKYVNSLGASNISAVVIENSTGKVRALVGSLDYWDRTIDGQVIGFDSYRSPGSALKPFLYTLAIQNGIISSQSLLIDVPTSFGSFSPVNFDERYRGLVKAEDALSFSLNVPFVYLLRKTGYREFLKLLKQGGLKGPVKGEYYGLALITGGMEVKLINLTNMYTALARGGAYAPYSLLKDSNIGKEKVLFQPGAVYITLSALSKRGRPDFPALGKILKQKQGPCFWKTGTSFGRRDAWSIGFRGKYTVGVWCGNFDGRGAQGIVGALAAAPVMFDIIGAVDGGYFNGKFPWTKKALSQLDSMEVCAFSGYKPTSACNSTKKVLVLKNAHVYEACPFHRIFSVEKHTGARACPLKSYKPGDIVRKSFLVVPPSVRKILGDTLTAPSYTSDCRLGGKRTGLVIVSPHNGTHYISPRDVNFKNGILLMAYTGSRNRQIYWFINGKLSVKTLSGESKGLKLARGKYNIVAVDTDGHTKSCVLWVE